ncbi:FRG domain-containing protein [Neobacillus sp. NPDC097160]|uniref:FRG domain-containing protein n=1 Tax=Neobacillus sp. NPDC097160 TaxID=3364298 RepID=UPI003810DAD5
MTEPVILLSLIEDQRIINQVIDPEHNEELINLMVKEYPDQIADLKLMKSEEIKNLVEGKFPTKDTNYKNRIVKNLELIKISTLVEEQQIEEVNIEISNDILETISLKDIIEIDELKEKQSLEISLNLLQKFVIERIEKDCWSEANVEGTLAKKFGLSPTKVRIINNLTEYIKFVSELDMPINFVSRGQKDCSYDLTPSLHRIYQEDHDIHAKRYESNFKQKMLYYEKDIKNRSNEELRAEGQHFGLPTNYLDFTEAHLISLLFAIEDFNYVGNHSIVFFIDACAYNYAAINRNEKLINFDSQEQIKSLEEFKSRSFFIKLANLNERIHFQKGCFLNISENELNKDSFKKRLAENCNIAVINKNFKKDILIELFHLGITFENIYPDKDNLVKSIKFNYEEIVGGII